MNDHSQRAHSIFGASSAHRWFNCPGSVALCRDIPETTSSYAEEGTQAHELLEAILRCELGGNDGPDVYEASIRHDAAPKDMRDAVQIAVDFVDDITAEYPDAVMLLEHKFKIPTTVPTPIRDIDGVQIGETTDYVFGTNDICLYIPSMRLLYVIDYKHGAGVYVEVKGNKQLRFYGLGALSCNPDWKVDTVALVIVQPRVHSFRLPIPEEWVSAEEIIAFGGLIDDHIRLAMQPDPPLIVGEEQCRFCPAKVICPAREKQALSLIGDSFGDVRQVTIDVLPDANTMPVDKIAHVLNFRDLAEDWFSSVAKKAFELECAGVHIPGRKIVEAQAKRSFEIAKDAEEQDHVAMAAKLAACAPGLEPDQFLTREVKGIGDSEKLIKAAAKAAVPKINQKAAVEEAVKRMAFLTTKKSSGTLSLVSEDDPRPAVNRAAVAFGDIVQIPHIADGE